MHFLNANAEEWTGPRSVPTPQSAGSTQAGGLPGRIHPERAAELTQSHQPRDGSALNRGNIVVFANNVANLHVMYPQPPPPPPPRRTVGHDNSAASFNAYHSERILSTDDSTECTRQHPAPMRADVTVYRSPLQAPRIPSPSGKMMSNAWTTPDPPKRRVETMPPTQQYFSSATAEKNHIRGCDNLLFDGVRSSQIRRMHAAASTAERFWCGAAPRGAPVSPLHCWSHAAAGPLLFDGTQDGASVHTGRRERGVGGGTTTQLATEAVPVLAESAPNSASIRAVQPLSDDSFDLPPPLSASVFLRGLDDETGTV